MLRHPVLDAELVTGEQWAHAVHVAAFAAHTERRMQIVLSRRRPVLATQPLGAVHRQPAYRELDVCHLQSREVDRALVVDGKCERPE